MKNRISTVFTVAVIIITAITVNTFSTAQDENGSITPDFTATLTAAPSTTDTPTPTPTATAFVTETATLTPTETASPVPDTLPTAESTPELTPLASPVETAGPEITPEGILPTLTPSPTLTMTETIAPGETPTPQVEKIILQGQAFYQRREPDHLGIRITILDMAGNRFDETLTDAAGTYTVFVPGQQAYQLMAQAPLHRRFAVWLQPGEAPPVVVLAGGDLNDDGCIGPTDLALITAHFEVPGSAATDITNDGVTESADLAIAAGNFDSACELVPPTPSPTPEITAEDATPEGTPPETTPEPSPVLDGITPSATFVPEQTLPGTGLPPEPGIASPTPTVVLSPPGG